MCYDVTRSTGRELQPCWCECQLWACWWWWAGCWARPSHSRRKLTLPSTARQLRGPGKRNNHRRRIKTEEKAEVVASVWVGKNFNQLLTALAVLHRMIWLIGWIAPGWFETFAFSSVFILLHSMYCTYDTELTKNMTMSSLLATSSLPN